MLESELIDLVLRNLEAKRAQVGYGAHEGRPLALAITNIEQGQLWLNRYIEQSQLST